MKSDFCACDHDTAARLLPLLTGLALGLCAGIGAGLWLGVRIAGGVGG